MSEDTNYRDEFSEIKTEYIDPDNNFEAYITGPSNRFAVAAAKAVADTPGKMYNPLYIYGEAGLGKTHLIQAIALQIQKQKKDLKVVYTTSERFTSELIEAIRIGGQKEILSFRDHYRNADVFIVDDIEFIIGKESTQQEFFHTFNILYERNKQIVIASDKPPKQLTTLEERFRSRFEMGLLADIGKPDYETRMAILQSKAHSMELDIQKDVLEYVAQNFVSNIREMEGALNRIHAWEKIYQETVTKENIESILGMLKHEDTKLTPEDILGIVSKHCSVSVQEIKGKKRSSEIAKARQISMYLLSECTEMSLVQIGELIGNRDHSTVIHGIKKIQEEKKKSDALAKQVDTIRAEIDK